MSHVDNQIEMYYEQSTTALQDAMNMVLSTFTADKLTPQQREVASRAVQRLNLVNAPVPVVLQRLVA